jgi:hypothetical protein
VIQNMLLVKHSTPMALPSRWVVFGADYFATCGVCSAKLICEETPGMPPISWLSNGQTRRLQWSGVV